MSLLVNAVLAMTIEFEYILGLLLWTRPRLNIMSLCQVRLNNGNEVIVAQGSSSLLAGSGRCTWQGLQIWEQVTIHEGTIPFLITQWTQKLGFSIKDRTTIRQLAYGAWYIRPVRLVTLNTSSHYTLRMNCVREKEHIQL